MIKLARLARRLRTNASGVAMVEFALAMPFFLTAGLWGTEVANFALVNMKINQLAIHVADNASRIGDTSTLENRQIFEEDINDLLRGASVQGGPRLALFEHGRVIISSLEVWNQSRHCDASGNCPSGNQGEGVQFIHWQRCKGALSMNSNFGNENQAKPNGIGPTGEEVHASMDSPVMFVEIYYDYQPLVSARFLGSTRITSTATFMVRDDRDQREVFKRNQSTPIADCSDYDSFA